MTIETLAVTGAAKEELLTSLAVLVAADAGAEITAEALTAIVEASGNKVSPMWATLFASSVTKAGGIESFTAAPGSGGGAASGGAAAPAAAVKEVVEEEEVDMGGNMDMFGGDADAGGGDY